MRTPTGIKDAKDRLNVLAYTNGVGMHMCKFALIGKILHPHCFKGVDFLPDHYYINKKKWVMRDICSDWFHKHVVTAACSLREAGLDEDCKILLFLDKCSVHPSAEMLIKNNAYARYFPQNVTSLIQPCAKVPLDQ